MEKEKLDELRVERSSVYGDVRDNHEGIAQMWAPILKEQADRIAKGEPLPAWVVTLMMVILKINRMRLTYHKDNFYDAGNYLRFTDELQDEDFNGDLPPGVRYVPYTPKNGPPKPEGKITRLVNKVKKLTGWS